MRISFLILFSVLAFSCKEISYPEPQPKGKKSLTSIPEKLHGIYVSKEDSKDDTLTIDRRGIFNTLDPSNSRDWMFLSDSLVMRQYKGLYFVSQTEKASGHPWRLRILQLNSNGDIAILSMPTDKSRFQKLLKDVNDVVSIDSTSAADEDFYQINPTPKQLMRLYKRGLFSEIFLLKKISPN